MAVLHRSSRSSSVPSYRQYQSQQNILRSYYSDENRGQIEGHRSGRSSVIEFDVNRQVSVEKTQSRGGRVARRPRESSGRKELRLPVLDCSAR